jgi:hypothetical protein
VLGKNGFQSLWFVDRLSMSFPFLWLVSPSVIPEMISDVKRELDFYVVEHPKKFPGTGHPWAYVTYHCNTGTNMYSSLHWSYFPKGSRGQRHSSRVIRLPDGNKAIFKPER